MAAERDKLLDWVIPGCIFIVDELWKILAQGECRPRPLREFRT
jgi:hypothetical protein